MTPIRCFLLTPIEGTEDDPKGPTYLRSDHGPNTRWAEAPPGALCLMGGRDPESRTVLMVKVPEHVDGTGCCAWCPDGSSSNNPAPAWHRTGTLPNITVMPSIHINPPTGWHGYLRDGSLVDA